MLYVTRSVSEKQCTFVVHRWRFGVVGYLEIFLNTTAYKLSPSCTWLRPDFSEGLTLNRASTTSAERACSSCGCCPGVQVPDPTTFHWSVPTGVAWMVTLYTVVGDMR